MAAILISQLSVVDDGVIIRTLLSNVTRSVSATSQTVSIFQLLFYDSYYTLQESL